MASPKTKGPPEPYRAPGAHGVALAAGWLAACQPRERPPLSKFMVEHARSDDGARIRPFPFQADIADAFTDPETAQLSVRKSSRIGYSTILQCFVAWRIKFDPGDPARLAFKRNLTSPRRFSAAGSTPKVKGFSRIDQLFEQGSQEYRYVPCPKCGHMQTLVFGDGTGPGIHWAPKEIPTRAWYQCEQGCEIDEAEKPWMDENGEWRAANPAQFPRHRSFHIWAAYSQHPGAAWLEIAREFMEVRKDPNLLRTFVNQVLGEAWAERGEAPEWQRLYDRREKAMRLGTPSAKACLLIGSADVQRGGGGRIDLDIWAFGQDRRREFVERVEVFGPIADKATWKKLDQQVARIWTSEDDRQMRLARVAVDSGDGENTMEVYAWARRHFFVHLWADGNCGFRVSGGRRVGGCSSRGDCYRRPRSIDGFGWCRFDLERSHRFIGLRVASSGHGVVAAGRDLDVGRWRAGHRRILVVGTAAGCCLFCGHGDDNWRGGRLNRYNRHCRLGRCPAADLCLRRYRPGGDRGWWRVVGLSAWQPQCHGVGGCGGGLHQGLYGGQCRCSA